MHCQRSQGHRAPWGRVLGATTVAILEWKGCAPGTKGPLQFVAWFVHCYLIVLPINTSILIYI